MAKKLPKATNESHVRKKSMKEKLTEVLELPKELVLDIPRLTLVGNKDMMIENYKRIIEYGSSCIRVRTGSGIVKLTGAGLIIKEITAEEILIAGEIAVLEFVTDNPNP